MKAKINRGMKIYNAYFHIFSTLLFCNLNIGWRVKIRKPAIPEKNKKTNIITSNSSAKNKSTAKGTSPKGIEVIVYEPILKNTLFFGSKVYEDLNDFKNKSSIILANRITEELKDVRPKVFTRDLFQTD